MSTFISKIMVAIISPLVCFAACSPQTETGKNANPTEKTSPSETHLKEIDPNHKSQTNMLQKERTDVFDLGQELVGHISLAKLSSELGKRDLTFEHILRAQKVSSTLSTKPKNTISDRKFRFGKLSYTVGTQSKSYYVPIVGDEFNLVVYNHAFKKGVESKITASDAKIVILQVELDLPKAILGLKATKSAIDKDNMAKATEELSTIFDMVIGSEEALLDPYSITDNNLALAASLVKAGNFIAASYALSHANNGLINLASNDGYEQYEEEISELKRKVSTIQMEMKTASPSSIQKSKIVMDIKNVLKSLRALPEEKPKK